MIVSVLRKFVYIAVPRTGSTATFGALKHFGAAIVPYGRSPCYCYAGDVNGFHDPLVSPEFADYFRFATFRNPYTRTVSHYLMAKHDELHRLHGLAACCAFPQFMELAIAGKMLMTQTAFLGQNKLNAKVFMEDVIEHQLQMLEPIGGEAVIIEQTNCSKYDRPWYAHYDVETIGRVAEWAKDDFATLGYSTDFADAVEKKLPKEPEAT